MVADPHRQPQHAAAFGGQRGQPPGLRDTSTPGRGLAPSRTAAGGAVGRSPAAGPAERTARVSAPILAMMVATLIMFTTWPM